MRFNYRGKNDELLTSVQINPLTKKVKFKNHTDEYVKCAFGKKEKVTYDDVIDFFKRRTYQENRADLHDILKAMGLEKYDPVAMCKYSKGRTAEDGKWIEFL